MKQGLVNFLRKSGLAGASGLPLNEGGSMRMLATILTLMLGLAGMLLAASVPEIDPGSAVSAVALLLGALLVTRGRRRR